MNIDHSTSNIEHRTGAGNAGPPLARRVAAGQRTEPRAGGSDPARHGTRGVLRCEYDLPDRLLEYAARIVRLVQTLPKTPVANHVAGQLLRCGTSPLSNHAEAQAAESPGDFVHKLRICLKELREARVWLQLCKRVPLIRPPGKLDPLLAETDELIAIFVVSIRTAEKSRKKEPRRREHAEPDNVSDAER